MPQPAEQTGPTESGEPAGGGGGQALDPAEVAGEAGLGGGESFY
jgi:hypothetical protein